MTEQLRGQARRTHLALATLLAVSLASVPSSAGAQPASDEVRAELTRAQERLDQLDAERGAALERYNTAQVALDDVTTRLQAARDEQATLRAEQAELDDVVAGHVRRLHKLGPAIELSSVVLARDPTEAGRKAAVLRHVLDTQRVDLEAKLANRASLDAVEQRLATARDEAERRAGERDERRRELEEAFSANEDEIAQLRTLLEERLAAEEEARRREEERLRQEALEREREQEERREAERRRRAQRASTPAADPVDTRAREDDTATGAPDSGGDEPAARASADVAVQTALAQLGKPYRWGGSGPGSFDCSGLTSYAWRAAGVSLPRTSGAQYGATRRISRNELQPGDLVFYHSPISHVAMYIGGGRVVESPNSGNAVRIRTDGITRSGVVGFGRP